MPQSIMSEIMTIKGQLESAKSQAASDARGSIYSLVSALEQVCAALERLDRNIEETKPPRR
ncbi:MAG TPA: hypothetical protein VH518_12600 [Tepidisphaeraceae bacterium]|jgi:hypothetical protein